MTIIRYLRVILLSLYWKMPQAKEVEFNSSLVIDRSDKREKVRRKRLRKNKQKLPTIQRKIFKHQSFRNSKPKDARFSDQKKLRRMFRGV